MKKIFLPCCFALSAISVFGTHLRCGFISASCVNPLNRTYQITLTVYTNDESDVLFGGSTDVLDFGDGTRILVPETLSEFYAPGIGIASRTFLHTYPGLGHYAISYSEPNRNAGIINLYNSVSTLFFMETGIVVGSVDYTNTTPELIAPQPFKNISGNEVNFSMGAYSSDDYVLYYELVNPLFGRPEQMNYKIPENCTINPYTGLVTWDTKFNNQYILGEFLFAVKITQYKRNGDDLLYVGHMVRDIQLLTESHSDSYSIFDNQELDDYERLYLPTGENKTFKVFFESANGSTVDAVVYSELTENAEALSFISYDSTSDGKSIKVLVLDVSSLESIDRDNPYLITARGTALNTNYTQDHTVLLYTRELPVILETEDELVDINVYPNPVMDYLTIELGASSTPVQITVLTLQGSESLQTWISNSTIINLHALPPGVYICKIRRNLTTKSIKLIKY